MTLLKYLDYLTGYGKSHHIVSIIVLENKSYCSLLWCIVKFVLNYCPIVCNQSVSITSQCHY